MELDEVFEKAKRLANSIGNCYRDRENLCCAHCKHNYLHQVKTEVWDREEDETSGLHVVVNYKGVKTTKTLEGNPSERRQASAITMCCEACGGYSVLKVMQHKGVTLIEYEAASMT